MQFRRLGFAASIGFLRTLCMMITCLVVTQGYAYIYMGTGSYVSAPIQFTTGVIDAPGPTTYPGFGQPLPPLQQAPLSQVITKAPNNPDAYQSQPRPYVVLPPVPAGAVVIPQNRPPQYLTGYPVKSGTLSSNVKHIVAQSKWGRVVWDAPYDYRWVGDITIHAVSVQDALNQLLDQYPLQAVFYDENHVVDIIPRRQA